MADEEAPGKADRDRLGRMAEAFDRIDAALFALGLQGLQRVTPSSVAELKALEQTAHNAGMVRVERQVETLATHVQRYLEKDPLFTMDAYSTTLNRLWLLNRQTRQRHATGALPGQFLELLGEARRSYEERTEPLTLQPLGAVGWVSDTDFVGITVHFWAEGHDGEPLQASNCKPCMYFGRDPAKLLNEAVNDTLTLSMRDLSHGAYEFRRAKVSRDGRLSLHKDLVVTPAPYLGAKAYAALAVPDWATLVDRLRAGDVQPVEGAGGRMAFLEPTHWGELRVDEKLQRATADLGDAQGATLTLEVPTRAENNLLLDNLEAMLGTTKRRARVLPDALFGRAAVSEGRLTFFPYTAVYNHAVVSSDRGRRRVNELHLGLESLRGVTAGEAK
jgi:hypothetical protein